HKNIISSSPGLSEDTVAIAILQDPDLIIHFTNAETLHKIAKTHPALLEAAQNIASAVHDEAHNFAVSTANAAASPGSAQNIGNSSSLENLSDDEEMGADSSQSSDSTQPSNSNSRSQSIISPAQLFAAIQRARRSTSGNGNTSSDALPSIPTSSQSNVTSGGVITFEMFNQAMQQAFATSAMNDITNSIPSSVPAASTPVPVPTSVPVTNQELSSPDDVQRQITIMHEMGLRNDAVNLQALTITNGDVQAAIELVLNGFGEN
ncbi:ubiquitin-like protein 7, partial [Phymastichus coffea]|uniref:ubiquitin-like protein 7 n=1 Tax=Phymastichus coffea TaxID=108790 RepID=UPI00273B7A33